MSMTHSVTITCRVDSMHDKKYLDDQVSSVFREFRNNVKGKKSRITENSDIERKYVFHRLSLADANRIRAISSKNRANLCLKSASVTIEPASVVSVISPAPAVRKSPSKSGSRATGAVTPPPPPSLSSVPSSSVPSPSISSSTKELVLNFGINSPNSFFPSDSESSSSSGDVGLLGALVTTPEIVLLRELAEIMGESAVKSTPAKIGKEVSKWFATERVQKVLKRSA